MRIPVIEMVEIGAGGGSIAHIDSLERLHVGPESAGSEPGPVAYGRGGTRATVTDADAALSKIDPARFAGGSMTFDVEKARAVIRAEVGGRLGFEGDFAAYAITEIVTENMAAAARAHALEWGKDIQARTMIAFGGAAPLHAARLGEKLGVERIVIPANAGVGSAIGFLLAPASYEVVRSRPLRLAAVEPASIEALFEEMRAEAEETVRAASAGPFLERRQAFMRYRGQGHEIAVDLKDVALEADALQGAFEGAYLALYGRIIPGMEVETLTWSLSLSGPSPQRRFNNERTALRRRLSEKKRAVFDAARGRRADHEIFERKDLAPGDAIKGPAVIVEDQTTTIVSAAFEARLDAALNIVLTRSGGP